MEGTVWQAKLCGHGLVWFCGQLFDCCGTSGTWSSPSAPVTTCLVTSDTIRHVSSGKCHLPQGRTLLPPKANKFKVKENPYVNSRLLL